MDKEYFKESVLAFAKTRTAQWRLGQAVFNFVDHVYNVARDVQFKDGVDCFHSDKYIDEFLDKAWDRICDNPELVKTLNIKS